MPDLQDMEICKLQLFEVLSKRGRDYLDVAKWLHKAHYSNRTSQPNGRHKWSGKNYLQKWGYDNLGDFAERELGISYRTAKTYLDIWSVVEKFDLPIGQVRSIDRSKMALIIQVMDYFNWAELLEVAGSKPLYEVKSYVNMLRGIKDPEIVVLYIPKKSVIYTAIRHLIKEGLQKGSDTGALTHICSEYLRSH